MSDSLKIRVGDGKDIIEVDIDPASILQTPLINKGTGFTRQERLDLKIDGMLPFNVTTIKEQVEVNYSNFRSKKSDIDKYLFLSDLLNSNEVLFYKLCNIHCEEVLPYIYTPTVGEASVNFSHLYNKSRGVYLSYPDRYRMEEILRNVMKNKVEVIVVTDGSRVLGLGDLGVGGMAISIGKLSMYTLFGGIYPGNTLPIVLDVGTNNENLLNDGSYLGWLHKRIDGEKYEEFIDLFVSSIQKIFPYAMIQWEDFSKKNAQTILNNYKDKTCCFNDDIQGTAAVVLAAILSSMKRLRQNINDQRIVLYGAGSAGIGISHLIKEEIKKYGFCEKDAKSNIYIIDSNGLVHDGLTNLDCFKKCFAQSKEKVSRWKVRNTKTISLLETIKNVRPTILIGTSAQYGGFSKEIVTEMKKYVDIPIIFPLSNPTSKSEANPIDIIHWTSGKCIIATGSPYKNVEYKGINHGIGQCNNVFIFPGIGLGVIASKATRVTDGMFLKAAERLSELSPILREPYAQLLPKISDLKHICKDIAISVAKQAIEEGVSENPPKDVEEAVINNMWYPRYPTVKNFR